MSIKWLCECGDHFDAWPPPEKHRSKCLPWLVNSQRRGPMPVRMDVEIIPPVDWAEHTYTIDWNESTSP